MYQMKLKQFKKLVEKYYQRITGKRKDKKAYISDLCNLFNIKVDNNRVEDYIIKELNVSIPYIKVFDKRDEITYECKCLKNINLFDERISSNYTFMYLELYGKEMPKITKIFFLGNSISFIENAVFENKEYELKYEKIFPYCLDLIHNNEEYYQTIRYSLNTRFDNKPVKQVLFNKIAKAKVLNTDIISLYEHIYTYGDKEYLEYKNNNDKYCYELIENVIYGINELSIPSKLDFFNGVCFQSLNCDVKKYLPYNIDTYNYQELINGQYNSAMIFRGGINKSEYYEIKIFKTDKNLRIIYNASDNILKKMEKLEQITIPIIKSNKKYRSITKGNITAEEIKKIISILSEYSENIFIKTVIDELNNFINRLNFDLKGKNIDIFSPSQLLTMPLDEIVEFINTDKNNAFNVIDNEFRNEADMQKDEKFKILKLNKL